MSDLAVRARVRVPAATAAVKALADIGVVREITGRRRGRVFAYGAYLDILSEGTEPL